MLLNNFKPLVSFYPDGTVVNVYGEDTFKKDILAGQYKDNTLNSHAYYASTSCFNYNSTTGGNSYIDEQTRYTWVGITDMYGNSGYKNSYNYQSQYSRQNGFVLFVGSGDTEPTADDFKLDSPLTLQVLNSACYHNANGKTIVQRSFKNNTEEDVTVREIGVYVFANSNDKIPIVMIARKLLDTPVVIPAGDNYTFHYGITSNIVIN